MYKLNEIRTIHLEITNKCQASCPMCARNLQGGALNPFMHLNEISLEQFTKWFSIEFIKQLDRLYMCGNLGDPIIAKDTIEIFSYCRNHNKNMKLGMNTNGSARSIDFWEKLADLNVVVRFGIDGLQDTHSLYRIGTDFDKIINNAKAFINAGGYAIWDMLVFQHNEHQVEDCRKLADSIGFKEFNRKDTARFKNDELIVIDKEGKKVNALYPTRKSIKLQKLSTAIAPNFISCKVKREGSIYITSNGIVTPCCWLGIDETPHVNPSRIDYMNKIGKFYSLEEQTIEQIFQEKIFDKIENLFEKNPLTECTKQCGIYDRFSSQF